MQVRLDLRWREAWVKTPALATAKEALQVSIDAEERAVPHSYHVVGGIGAQEAPVGDRDACLSNGQVLPTHESDTFGIVGSWH